MIMMMMTITTTTTTTTTQLRDAFRRVRCFAYNQRTNQYRDAWKCAFGFVKKRYALIVFVKVTTSLGYSATMTPINFSSGKTSPVPYYVHLTFPKLRP
ncbi:hypothetical protein M0804_001595 [Polistes exclamans]|nr:hypothetical protein M0804_001595 [Polistes exclamans]